MTLQQKVDWLFKNVKCLVVDGLTLNLNSPLGTIDISGGNIDIADDLLDKINLIPNSIVASVTGDGVDNTDPSNPVLEFPNLTQVISKGGNINISQLTNNGDGTSPFITVSTVNSSLALKADISYVDSLAVGVFRAAGDWNASVGTFPTTGTGIAGAVRRGDTYKVSVAGTIAGKVYDAGDNFYAVIANPGQTASNWGVFEANTDQATSSYRGTMLLYNTLGTNTDGTITQSFITSQLNSKNSTFIKSNENLNLASRKGDVLYGILDQYTNEEITLSKVTGTPVVDNIIYFQVGTEYFIRARDNYYNVKWWGAKADGLTDDTVKIQNAINFLSANKGGTLFFPIGIYIVNGNLITSDNNGKNPNSQLFIPSRFDAAVAGTDTDISIRFLGEVPPSKNASGYVDDKINLMDKGVLIKSTLTYASATGSLPSVFGGKGNNPSYPFNIIDVTFENIWVRTHMDSVHGSYMTAFNCLDIAFTTFKSCRADIDVSGFNSVMPDGINIGFAGVKSNGGTTQVYSNCISYGYGIGYHIGEHGVVDNCEAVFCKYGYDFGKAGHSSTVYHALSQWNRCSISFNKYNNGYNTTAQYVNNYGMVIENTQEGYWYDSVTDIDDPTSGILGNIFYSKTIGGAFNTNDDILLTKIGGTKVNTRHIARAIATYEKNGSFNSEIASTVIKQGDGRTNPNVRYIANIFNNPSNPANPTIQGAIIGSLGANAGLLDYHIYGTQDENNFPSYLIAGNNRSIVKGRLVLNNAVSIDSNPLSPVELDNGIDALQVNGTSLQKGDAKYQNSSGASIELKMLGNVPLIYMNGGYVFALDTGVGVNFNAPVGQRLQFRINNDTTEQMTYTSDKKLVVGFGQNVNTGERLQVNGTGKFTGLVKGIAAINADEFIIKSQLDAVANVTKTGSNTQSGNGIATSFNIPHGLGTTPTYWNAVATSAPAGNISYVTADATNIIVFYSVAPSTGTNNLKWNWIAR